MADMNSLIEKLAALEHLQWETWSKHVAKSEMLITQGRRDRWRSYWKPYAQLPESVKEYDREWARKVVDLLKSEGVI